MAHRCEDFPACGHGPAPFGDGGGCPDAEGRFGCVTCGALLPRGARSSICGDCQRNPSVMYEPGSPEWYDAMDDGYDGEDYPDEPSDGFLSDADADADALSSIGWGTDEDYGYYGDDF